MLDPDDIDAPDIIGDLGRDAMKVVGPLALLLFAPVLLLLAAFGGLPDAIETNAAPASAAEIEPDQFAVMQQVSNQTGIPWQILAAISKVESGFGANMGPSSAGAVGYCQFLPSTWAAYGVDGDGDGIADPWSFRDCIPAMAGYLMANGAPADMHRALSPRGATSPLPPTPPHCYPQTGPTLTRRTLTTRINTPLELLPLLTKRSLDRTSPTPIWNVAQSTRTPLKAGIQIRGPTEKPETLPPSINLQIQTATNNRLPDTKKR